MIIYEYFIISALVSSIVLEHRVGELAFLIVDFVIKHFLGFFYLNSNMWSNCNNLG